MARRIEPVRQALPERRPELDAIRLLVVLGLIFFHSSLVFATDDDYYVKNSETTEVILIAAGFAVVWAMPALFLIAGLGSWYSLRRRGAAGFVKERLLRLGVPLVFTTLVLNPLPQWLRYRSEGRGHDESYLAFLPRFYDVHVELDEFPFLVQGEYFETGHLWFVLLLLAFSLMLAPLFRVLPADRVRPVADRVALATLRVRPAILLPAIPLALLCAFAGMEENYAGWHRWAYLVFFAAGCALAADDRFRTAMRRAAVPAGWLGAGLFALCGPGFAVADEPFTEMTALSIAIRALFGAAGWCLVVAILGHVDRRRATRATTQPPERQPSVSRRRAHAYLAAAALPIYVLHQPVVVAVAYFVVGWSAPIPVEYAVIVTVSLALTLAAYEFLVRHTRVTRVLFGMRS
ncbi:acyltransferase [Streptomyces montanus]|uniref:Acyltransferase n=1 Tax=Streptomyces montanus TaxID=2580423 RepID=A0A5R9FAN7_9ACTN|nr:acyltransferase [Streptomyces montanus]TLS39589.1 acyltransferase [Streptomyces montanus]